MPSVQPSHYLERQEGLGNRKTQVQCPPEVFAQGHPSRWTGLPYWVSVVHSGQRSVASRFSLGLAGQVSANVGYLCTQGLYLHRYFRFQLVAHLLPPFIHPSVFPQDLLAVSNLLSSNSAMRVEWSFTALVRASLLPCPVLPPWHGSLVTSSIMAVKSGAVLLSTEIGFKPRTTVAHLPQLWPPGRVGRCHLESEHGCSHRHIWAWAALECSTLLGGTSCLSLRSLTAVTILSPVLQPWLQQLNFVSDFSNKDNE